MSLLQSRQSRVHTRLRRAELDSENSLAQYLGHVVIDSRPVPLAWGLCWEPWQGEIFKPLIPAMEQVAGLRDDYHGPRSFFLVLPRGHDKTGLIGRLANWAVAFSRRPISAVAAAAKQDQAAILLDSMKAEIRLNPWLARRLVPRNYLVEGRGGKLQVISAEADTSSGLKADLIVCDELTFWPKRELFDVLYSGREKRPNSVFIVITNAGLRGSWQHELLGKAKADRVHWHVHEAPTDTTLASWMTPDRIHALREMIPAGHARRVLDNHWIDQTERPLVPIQLIERCQADCLWPDGVRPRGELRPLFLGIDVGRTQDRTVIWTMELIGDVAWTREIRVLHNSTFAEQKGAITDRIDRSVAGVRIDRGALGYQLAEELEHEYPYVAEGVQLSETKQGMLALALKTAFEGGRIRVPVDPLLIADVLLVEEIETGASGVPRVKTSRGPTGHADRFWAAALALSAIPLKDPQKMRYSPHCLPRGIRASAAHSEVHHG